MNRRLALYFALAYAISWIVWLPLVLGETGAGFIHNPLPDSMTLFGGWFSVSPVLVAGTFGPAVAALITRMFSGGKLHIFRIRAPLRSMPTGLIAGALCILAARWAFPAITLTRPGSGPWNWPALLDIRHYFLPSIIGGPLGEEPGWRGFALPRMQSRSGPTSASLVLGLLWAGWHLPLFLIHGWTTAPAWAFFAIQIGLSVFMTFGYNLSGGSVLVAILLHATFNSAGPPLHGFLESVQLRGHFDEVVATGFSIGAAILIVSTRGRLGHGPAAPERD